VNLFGRWWEDVDTDIRRARVREIPQGTAAPIILAYEWLGNMPAIVSHCFGIYFDGHLGGVVVYSPEYSENLGVWDRYGYTGKMILLSRGACVHWAHQHAGSKLIRRSMALLPSEYEVVTATVDPAAGEIGTIYQACGFTYVGAMRDNPRWSDPSRGQSIRPIVRLASGKQLHERTARHMVAETAGLAGRIPGASVAYTANKGRYFAFRGPRADAHRAALRDLIKSYPKRAA
jgi:hypothetical protein